MNSKSLKDHLLDVGYDETTTSDYPSNTVSEERIKSLLGSIQQSNHPARKGLFGNDIIYDVSGTSIVFGSLKNGQFEWVKI